MQAEESGYWLICRFDLMAMISAIAAIIGGVVGFGSNSSTSKQTTAAMKAAETQRTALIEMIDLRTVGGSGGGLLRNRDAAKFYYN